MIPNNNTLKEQPKNTKEKPLIQITVVSQPFNNFSRKRKRLIKLYKSKSNQENSINDNQEILLKYEKEKIYELKTAESTSFIHKQSNIFNEHVYCNTLNTVEIRNLKSLICSLNMDNKNQKNKKLKKKSFFRKENKSERSLYNEYDSFKKNVDECSLNSLKTIDSSRFYDDQSSKLQYLV